MEYQGIKDRKISFLGAGVIAEVFITRLLETGASHAENIMATDVRAERLEELRRKFGIRTSADNKAGAKFGDIVVLAVPSGVVKAVLSESCQSVNERQIMISLAAAVPIWLIESALCKPVPVVRVIPNIPSLIGHGFNPYCLGHNVSENDIEQLNGLMESFGDSMLVGEGLMNAFTALTAVGPTFIFPVIKALRDASMKLGLTGPDAMKAIAQTIAGAADLVLETDKLPEQLNLMISTRTLNEASAEELFSQALTIAFSKIVKLESKLTE